MTQPAEATRAAAARLPTVQVSIRLFAGLRERAGTGARDLELPDGATLTDVWAALELGDEPPGSSTRSTSATRPPTRCSPTATRWR